MKTILRLVQLPYKKIISNSGETLVETLVSILISALSLVVLAMAIGTSVNLVKTSKESIGALYASESVMVNATPSDSFSIAFSIPLELDDRGNIKQEEPVKASTDTDNNVTLYELDTETP